MGTPELIKTFSQNPYGFFWILRENDPNPYLNKQNQGQMWQQLLKEMDWHQASQELSNVELIMITDNGDYVFIADEETILCNPRSSMIEKFKMTPSAFLRNVTTIGSHILPKDIRKAEPEIAGDS